MRSARIHVAGVYAGGRFNHRHRCQLGDLGAHAVETPHWRRSQGAIDRSVDLERAQGLVRPTKPMFRTALHGYLPNRDTWV